MSLQIEQLSPKQQLTPVSESVQMSSLMADQSSIDDLLPIQNPAHNSNNFFKSILNKNNFCILLGPVLCLLIFFFVNLGTGRHSSRNMLAVLTWIFFWWFTGAVPMAVTSMAPLFLFPLFGLATADEVAKSYMDDIIALVLGSFILALAVEHYNIHRRLALNITYLFCGDPAKPHLLLLGICGTSFFVSMWMHNTPAAVMMISVATGILQRFPTGEDVHPDVRKFRKGVILGVIYGVEIGGMSTLTGTGVNLILVGMWEKSFPKAKPIGFSTWSLFAFPLALLIFFALWGILCFFYCSKDSSKVVSSYIDREDLKRELESLGPMSFAEKMILAIFGVLVLLWMTRSLTNDVPGWGSLFHGRVGDGTVSVMMATLLFVIPNKINEGSEKLMDWKKCKNLHWDVILLLGAGFAIAQTVRTSGLTGILSDNLKFLKNAPYLSISPIVCLLSGTITEFTSNNATITLILPILIELAKIIKIHPLLLMVPGAIGAQFAFLLPTGTPSNIVGFTTGQIDIKDMVMNGIPLKIAGIAALSLLMPTLGVVVFQTRKAV